MAGLFGLYASYKQRHKAQHQFMSPKALPYISLLAGIWGTTLVMSRFAIGQFAPLTYVTLQLLIASAAYIVVFLVNRKRHFPKGRQLWGQGTLLGIFSTALPMTLITLSLQYQSSGVTSLILTLGPALTVLLAHFFLHDEKLSKHKIGGITMALSGGTLLILLGENGLPDVKETNPIGYILVLTAIFVGSFMVIYIRKTMQKLDSFEVNSVRLWTAGLFMLPVTFFTAGYDLSQVNVQGLTALLYGGIISTFAGVLLDYYNIKRFGATASSMVSVLIPVVAIIIGSLLLGEAITPGMILAMVLIIGGVAILNLGGEGKKQQTGERVVNGR